jgi:hypothetical protein
MLIVVIRLMAARTAMSETAHQRLLNSLFVNVAVLASTRASCMRTARRVQRRIPRVHTPF